MPFLQYPHALVTCYLHSFNRGAPVIAEAWFFFFWDTQNFLLFSKFSKRDVRVHVHLGQKIQQENGTTK